MTWGGFRRHPVMRGSVQRNDEKGMIMATESHDLADRLRAAAAAAEVFAQKLAEGAQAAAEKFAAACGRLADEFRAAASAAIQEEDPDHDRRG